MLGRADLRRSWRAAFALGLIAAVTGGLVVAIAIGARRTQTAYDRLVATSHAPDVRVDASDADRARLGAVARRPEVEQVTAATGYVGRRLRTQDWTPVAALHSMRPLEDMVVVRGRTVHADAPREVVVTERTASVMHLDVGGRLTVALYESSQLPEVRRDYFVRPAGPRVTVRVVGVTRDPSDAQLDESAKLVTAGPGFRAVAGDGSGIADEVYLRLRPGTSVAGFTRAVQHADASGSTAVRVLAVPSASVRDNGSTVVAGLLVCMVVAGAAGALALGQAAARQVARRGDERRTLIALGTTGPMRALAAVVGAWPAILAGALGAVVVAIAVSAAFPVGLMRAFEPSPGVELNILGLGVGAFAVAAATALVIGLAAWLVDGRSRRPAVRRPSRLIAGLVHRGAPPPVVVGIGMAVQPGSGPGATPVRSAFVGATLAVAGLVAALGFGASLDRFVTTPTRYGLGWDVSVEAKGREAELLHALAARPEVTAVGRVRTARVRIGGATGDLYALDGAKGSIRATVVRGRAPVTDGEIALGADVRRHAGADIGDAVTALGDDGRSVRLRLVGETLPVDPQSADGLGGTMLATPATFARVRHLGTTEHEAAVRFAPGADIRAVTDLLRSRFPGALTDESYPRRPAQVRNLAQLGSLPMIVGVALVVVGLAALAHALVTVVRRRRRDLAVLRTLGFSGHQLTGTVLTVAAAMSVGGLVVGVPLGILLARLVWGDVARGLHVDPSLASPLLPVVAVAVAAAFVAAALAWWPARGARRIRPADTLRGE
jgi:hypothetical protein